MSRKSQRTEPRALASSAGYEIVMRTRGRNASVVPRPSGGRSPCPDGEEAVDSRNVLVVEDDIDLSALVAGLLTRAGYQPITIADHAEIATAVEKWKPSCVILDGEVRSTGESRTWVDAAAIRRAHPTLPVVMFTADAAALAEMRAGRSDRSQAASVA